LANAEALPDAREQALTLAVSSPNITKGMCMAASQPPVHHFPLHALALLLLLLLLLQRWCCIMC
jgi:hypothetical protein